MRRHRQRLRRHKGGPLAAVSLAGALALALAPVEGQAKPSQNLLRCTASVTVQVPAGEQEVFPGQSPGTQLGSIRCARRIGAGLEGFSYKIPDSGDEQGALIAYFKGGTIRARLDLVPQEGTLAPNGTTAMFGYSAFAGPLTHVVGTGALAGVSATGTASCTSEDGLHFKCVERL